MMAHPTDKKNFDISQSDARKIVDALEFCASWDKVSIYYDLKKWIKEQE
jgi:hypothetical protein